MRLIYVGVATGFFAIGVGTACAQDRPTVALEMPAHPSRFMLDFDPVAPPPAFGRFCNEAPGECAPHPAAESFDQSPRRLEELDEVNRRVNRSIIPETDIAHYGIEDYWTLPKDRKGDCEDYALLKRHILIAMGWPSSALLITVVRAENDDGHAVLTARTNSGDLILDNRAEDIKFWYQTAYKFKMRQSPQNPRIWLDLDPADDALPAPIAELKYFFSLDRSLNATTERTARKQ